MILVEKLSGGKPQGQAGDGKGGEIFSSSTQPRHRYVTVSFGFLNPSTHPRSCIKAQRGAQTRRGMSGGLAVGRLSGLAVLLVVMVRSPAAVNLFRLEYWEHFSASPLPPAPPPATAATPGGT